MPKRSNSIRSTYAPRGRRGVSFYRARTRRGRTDSVHVGTITGGRGGFSSSLLQGLNIRRSK